MSITLFLDRLSNWVEKQPDKPVWTFLNDKSEPVDSYTYLELERVTSALAVYLSSDCQLNVGDRALLVFFPGLQFMISLIACFKAGVIAVPVFPPDPRRQKKDLHHFVSIQSSSGATVALTHGLYNAAKKLSDIKHIFSSGDNAWPELRWITIDSVISAHKTKGPLQTVPHTVQPNDVAFLQYTSGSTSEPKGVMISHMNLAHNEMLIARELRTTPETICVSWLPQYHDMGLIGSYLGLVYCGGSGFYLSPISFLKDPTQWVRALSTYRATHTQAPNFAFALVTRKFKEARKPIPLDLSSVQHMINAAEPVDAVALDNFIATFSPLGLPRSVVVPTYGLAEHTVFVCSGGLQRLRVSKASLEGREVEVTAEHEVRASSEEATLLSTANGHNEMPEGEVMIVGCGHPGRGEGVVLKIVDPVTMVLLTENQIGEIWVSSPSKALGYWNKPELSEEEFQARPVEYDGSETFLRTGDLGFLHRDELFICGRLKDLIIVRGSNHYPQDIERTAEAASPHIRPGCSAAFGVASSHGSHTEGVVYVAEIREGVTTAQLTETLDACRHAVASDHGVAVQSMILIKTRTIDKTTSGKIARSWCKRSFLQDTLQVVARWDAPARSSADDSELGGTIMGVSEEAGADNATPVGHLEMDGAVATEDRDKYHSMSVSEIESLLEQKLVQITANSATGVLPTPVDRTLSMSAIGLESMTMVQFKGVIENRFYCEFPDEFMFTEYATLNELAQAIQNGSLTQRQVQLLESAPVESGGLAHGEGGTTTIVQQDPPCCPWFTCCY